MSFSIVLLVTHLLGSGHLTRAASLAKVCAQSGHHVTLISGGLPNALTECDDFDLVQLPPLRIEGTRFTHLLDADGVAASAALLAEREDLIVNEIRKRQPDILITELFPFGRRVLSQEFLAAIEAARRQMKPVTVLCSIRDILAPPSSSERSLQTTDRIKKFYTGILVHGDPFIVPLDRSWPVTDALKPLLFYTGYIDNPPALNSGRASRPGRDIIVSGGFSAASLSLFRSALDAARLVGHTWHILVGNGVRQEEFQALSEAAPINVLVERARPDFRFLLQQAKLSVSQCGYNTAIDVLSFPLRRLFVPFEEGDETEQLLRAETLSIQGLSRVLRQKDVSSASLAEMVVSLLQAPPQGTPSIKLDGAESSVRLIEKLHGQTLP